MKHIYGLLTALLFVLALLYWIDSTARYKDFTQKLEAENMAKELRIEQLEKEVRLLKTDLDIKENGFREK